MEERHLLDESDFERIAELIDKKLQHFVADHPLSPQLLYTRNQAANLLGTSLSTLKLLIDRGDLRVRRWGSSVLISHEELLRISRKDFSTLWPAKSSEDKTTLAK